MHELLVILECSEALGRELKGLHVTMEVKSRRTAFSKGPARSEACKGWPAKGEE